ncbi:MAG: type IIL restriction-modification enzyme MmeI, partial [Actinomycetota bacterium]
AAKYVRPFVGARQLIHNEPRWCLWLVDLDPSDIARSPILRRRLDAVRQFRAASKAESTRQMAETPHLFGQRS